MIIIEKAGTVEKCKMRGVNEERSKTYFLYVVEHRSLQQSSLLFLQSQILENCAIISLYMSEI